MRFLSHPALFKTMKEFTIITEITPDVLHGAMDQHAENIAMAFSEWCASSYHREFESLDSSLPVNERKYRQFWMDNDQREYSTKQLYDQFKEFLCKNVNQDASANSIRKQENQ